jgi:hypothetical protein
VKDSAEKTKAGMVEMEVAVDVFEERLNKVDTTGIGNYWSTEGPICG